MVGCGWGDTDTERWRQPCLSLPRAFSYMDNYNWDIRFDNIYISTYFYQIDARRKKLVRELNPARGCLVVPCMAP